MEARGHGRRKSAPLRHCERSEAIAYTTDRLGALRTGLNPNATKISTIIS
jgi:hypothetical protein